MANQSKNGVPTGASDLNVRLWFVYVGCLVRLANGLLFSLLHENNTENRNVSWFLMGLPHVSC